MGLGKLLFTLVLLASSSPAQTILWQREGRGDSARYGAGVFPLGDQNDDGFADWAVMSYGGGPFGSPNATIVELFHGSDPLPTAPYRVLHGDPADAWAIIDFIVPGDLNGDGYRDYGISRRYAADPTRRVFFLYWGGPQADTTAEVVMHGENVISWYAGLGDFNGDGIDDLYYYHFPAFWIEGFWGGADFDTLSDWQAHDQPGHLQQTFPVGLGDLNGDGATDLAGSGSPTCLYLGGTLPDTLPAYAWTHSLGDLRDIVPDLTGDRRAEALFAAQDQIRVVLGRAVPEPVLDATLDFPCGGYTFGWALPAGDLNRDGYQDFVAVAEYCGDSYFGTLAMYLGGPSLNPRPAWLIRGWYNEFLGVNEARGAGDVNGDGVDDLLVGAETTDVQDGWRGRALILSGDTTLIAGAEDPLRLPPSSFRLSAYPNPFNGRTRLAYHLPVTGPVTVTVFDVLGREVARLVDQVQTAGEQSVLWHAAGVGSGVYLVRVAAGGVMRTQKVLLVK